MTKVDVGFAAEELRFDDVGDEARLFSMSQRDDKEKHEISCMDTDIISELDNSSGPMKFSNLKENRWKPYPERERQRLEEQNTRRAILAQKELLRCGLSLTSSCIPHFDDQRSDDQLEKIPGGKRHREISSSSEDFLSSPDEEEASFDEARYFSVHIGKSSQDLIMEIIDAEDKVDELRKALNATRLHNQLSKRRLTFDAEAELEKIRVYRKEIEKLNQENSHLLSENRKLNIILNDAD